MLIILAIEVIYYLINNYESKMITDYGPLVVLALLVICFIYSTILLVIEIKNSISKMCEDEEEIEEDSKETMKLFNQ